MSKVYLVTGGAGFIGSCLAKSLIERGNSVHILDDLSTGLERNIPAGAEFHNVDISDKGALKRLKIPSGIDCVFHLAAQSSGEASFRDPLRDMEVNYEATYNILELAKSAGCQRFIYTSSMSVYGAVPAQAGAVNEEYPCKPVSYYGCNKLASEKMIEIFCRNADIKYTIFRLFNGYGPGQNMLNMQQGMVSIYLSYLMNDTQVHVKGSLERFRDFIYIDDIIEAFSRSEGNEDTYSGVFNLGTSVKTAVKELLTLSLGIYGKDDFDKWVKVEGSTPGDITGCVADINKLKAALRWEPEYELKQGLLKMKEWLDQTKEAWINKR